jgi:hypothetical protein
MRRGIVMVENPLVMPELGSFFQTDSRNILLLLVSHPIFYLGAPTFVLCPHLRLSFAFLAAHFLGHLAHLLTLPWTVYNSTALVSERTIPIESPSLFGEVSANFVDRGCRVISTADPYGRILAFLDRFLYFFFQISPRLYSWDWMGPVPESLLLRKSGPLDL